MNLTLTQWFSSMRRLPSGPQVIMVGGVLVVCLMLVTAFFWYPAYQDFNHQRQALAQAQRQTVILMQQQQTQQQVVQAQQLMQHWQQTYARNGQFSQSDLLSQVRRYAGATGVRMQTQSFEQTRPRNNRSSQSEQAANHHALALEVTGSYPEIRRFVQRLTDKNKLLFVTQLNMSRELDLPTQLRARIVIRAVSHLTMNAGDDS